MIPREVASTPLASLFMVEPSVAGDAQISPELDSVAKSNALLIQAARAWVTENAESYPDYVARSRSAASA